MIPDEKNYMIVDISSRKKIGKLDESFVLNYGFEGAKFILSGRHWTIVKREDEEILVAQSKEIGNVPAWTGEDIPIPFEVAREVGSLRRLIANNIEIKNYPCDKISFEKIIQQIENGEISQITVKADKLEVILTNNKKEISNKESTESLSTL